MENINAPIARRFGESLENAGHAALRVEAILQHRVDIARAKEADAKIADAFREAMSSPNGYLNKRGREVIDTRQETIDALDVIRRQHLDKLTPEQRDLLAESDEARYQHARNALDGHYTKEIENYETSEAEARANSLMIDAANSYFDPQSPLPGGVQDPQAPRMTAPRGTQRTSFEDNRAGMREELLTLARRKGLGPAETKSLLQKADDNIDVSIIGRLIRNGQTEDARAYFTSKREKMGLTAAAHVEQELRSAKTDEASLDLFSTIVNDATRQDLPLSEQERIAKAILTFQRDDKQLTAEVYDKTVARVEHHFSQQWQARSRQKAEMADQVDQVFTRDAAADFDSLPKPMQQQIERLGMVGDVDRIEAQTRARRIAESKQAFTDLEMAQDIKRIEVLNGIITHLTSKDYLPPEGADEATAKAFEEDREVKLEQARQARAALDARNFARIGVELPPLPAKPEPKKTIEEVIREATESARKAFGG